MKGKSISGRKCYDHLGGRLGSMLLEFYLDQGWILLEGGKSTVYIITPRGYEAFARMGLSLPCPPQDEAEATTIGPME